ncbi:hypothetical protein E0Z10_g2078 [Xylaria hypoxylon]|uniref:Uncharacterized protein n=1 Tax=Xylaria hypoxylon TaxID=37992 RepID=A0A4Z0ZD86_9PEZI|nr:hypothetical protein E0Z10_g2078 [Xylaria hypoxylon]
MVPTKWFIERKPFGSKSIAFRPKPSLGLSAATRWRPKGPFRLFGLPPELRAEILNFALLNCEEQVQVLQIFLASRRLYTEAAAIFYHDIWLDITDRTEPPGLLAELTAPLSPRLHVRTMDLKIYPKNNLRSFNEVYVPLLREMAEQGGLHTLHLEINGRFPRLDFWTDHWSDDDEFCETEIPLLIGPETNIEYLGPAFLAAQPFQAFLDFLSDPRIPKVALYTSSADHYQFWCDCHRKLSSKLGLPCSGGSWRGKSKRLKVNQKHLLRLFRSARAVQISAAVTSARVSGASTRNA